MRKLTPKTDDDKSVKPGGLFIHIMTAMPKKAPEPKSHGFGHSVANRTGSLRLSGKPGAHRIGKR